MSTETSRRSFEVSEEVADAVAGGRPVVALESTIFTHGLPRPRNVEVALAAEERLRASGVVPATIGVVDGTAVVGLRPEQIAELCGHDPEQDKATDEVTEGVMKVSLRDLVVAGAQRRSGGTTVAATAFLAAKAGIAVFATGGLGGVHRGAADTFDESADLPVLAQTPIVMVAAGVKSILDIGASLERLETLSITVVGYGTTSFPGFYVADSGFPLDTTVSTPGEVADLMRAHHELGVPGAVVVANPVDPAAQLDPVLHDRVLREALDAARDQQVAGHDTTPFLLDYIQRTTGGASLEVNVAVYESNVDLAGRIAEANARVLA